MTRLTSVSLNTSAMLGWVCTLHLFEKTIIATRTRCQNLEVQPSQNCKCVQYNCCFLILKTRLKSVSQSRRELYFFGQSRKNAGLSMHFESLQQKISLIQLLEKSNRSQPAVDHHVTEIRLVSPYRGVNFGLLVRLKRAIYRRPLWLTYIKHYPWQ